MNVAVILDIHNNHHVISDFIDDKIADTAKTTVFYCTFMIEGNAKFQLEINESKERKLFFIQVSQWILSLDPQIKNPCNNAVREGN